MKKKKKTTLKEETGRLLFDVGKLGLGTIVLGSILRSEVRQDILLTVGSAAVIVCFIAALVMVTREIKLDKAPQTSSKRKKLAARFKRHKRRKR